MHTYRDAIREVVGTFVLYPGTTHIRYPATSASPGFEGIGALPLIPGEGTRRVEPFLREFVDSVVVSSTHIGPLFITVGINTVNGSRLRMG